MTTPTATALGRPGLISVSFVSGFGADGVPQGSEHFPPHAMICAGSAGPARVPGDSCRTNLGQGIYEVGSLRMSQAKVA